MDLYVEILKRNSLTRTTQLLLDTILLNNSSIVYFQCNSQNTVDRSRWYIMMTGLSVENRRLWNSGDFDLEFSRIFEVRKLEKRFPNRFSI